MPHIKSVSEKGTDQSTSAKTLSPFRFFVWHALSDSGGRDELCSRSPAIPTPFAMLRACHTRRRKRKELAVFGISCPPAIEYCLFLCARIPQITLVDHHEFESAILFLLPAFENGFRNIVNSKRFA